MEFINVLYLNSAVSASKDLSRGEATFNFNPPLNFPAGMVLKVASQSFSFTNFFINISPALNNNQFSYSIAGVLQTAITIPTGSYSTTELSQQIDALLVNAGVPTGSIALVPDYSTNKVQFNIKATYQVNFPVGSPYTLLGCVQGTSIPPAPPASDGSYLAPNVAQFNTITAIYLHTSLTNNAIFSGRQSDILDSVIPVVPVGSIQQSQNYNLVWVDAHELVGATVNQISLKLTDQANQPIVLSDDFSSVIIIADDHIKNRSN